MSPHGGFFSYKNIHPGELTEIKQFCQAFSLLVLFIENIEKNTILIKYCRKILIVTVTQ